MGPLKVTLPESLFPMVSAVYCAYCAETYVPHLVDWMDWVARDLGIGSKHCSGECREADEAKRALSPR